MTKPEHGGSTDQISRTAIEAEAYSKSIRSTTDEMAAYLVSVLETPLTAKACGVDRATVSRWVNGSRVSRDNETRLRLVYRIVQTLISTDSAYAARAWMIGMNPLLADESPVEALSEGREKEVLDLARHYVESN